MKNYLKIAAIAVLVLIGFGFVSTNDAVKTNEFSEAKNASLLLDDDMPKSVDEVIKWNFKFVPTGDCEGKIVMTVKQLDHWHIYSQTLPEGAVAFPTTFGFKKSDNYELIGAVSEFGASNKDNQGIPERAFYGDQAKFEQKIRIKSKNQFNIDFTYDFMACKTSCFMPEYRDSTIKIKGCKQSNNDDSSNNSLQSNDIDKSDTTNSEVNETNDSLEIDSLEDSKIGFEVYAKKLSGGDYEIHINPVIKEGQRQLLLNPGDLEVKFEGNIDLNGKPKKFKTRNLNNQLVYKEGEYIQKIKVDSKDTAKLISGEINFRSMDEEGIYISTPVSFEVDLRDSINEQEDSDSKGGLWKIFWLSFLGGLVALFTPCVFPMIPMTVSFFTKGSEDRSKGLRRGVFYGICIFAIYVLLSAPFHLMSLNSNIFNEISTNVPLNLFFFTMLFVFGLSFLGAFEITLPSKWTNKADKASNLGGILGIFFMALTLAIVSFSCTGPILGGLLANAADGASSAWFLTVGMAGFGVALGLPFALFAIFPSWLNSLPQSGGWLNSVKVVLGFLEIAFAFKFLSGADLSLQAHLLERELFIAIWIGIFGAMTMYLFGLFRASHDSPLERLSTFRLVFATFALAFTLYLIPGLFGAPVKLVAAFAPPQSYSEIPYGIHGSEPEYDGELPEGAEFEHNMIVFRNNLETAEKFAKENKLPILLDFTGHYCVNCRLMESNVWSAPKVHKLMDEKMVVVSLYVDERTELPKPEVSKYTGNKLITVGDKWSDLQISVYKSSSQPQYVMLDNNGNKLNTSANYTKHGSPDEFEKWLKKGLNAYDKSKDKKIYYGQVSRENE